MFNDRFNRYKGLPGQGIRPGDLVFGMAVDLKLIVAFVVVMFIFVFIPGLNQSIIRQALGLVMILFVPGYALVALIFPGRSDIGGMERLLLSFTFSVVTLAMMGLGLNYTPWGIRLVPVFTGMAIFILACTLFANWLRHGIPEDERFLMDLTGLYHIISRPFKALGEAGKVSHLNRMVNIILLLSIILSIGTLAYAVALPKQSETFTEFYILGPDGRADNYPSDMVLGNGTPVIVGVTNHENTDMSYELVVSLNDSHNDTRLYSEQLTLADNQTWQKKIDIVPTEAGNGMELEFFLYKSDDLSTPYSELHLWLDVTAPVGT